MRRKARESKVERILRHLPSPKVLDWLFQTGQTVRFAMLDARVHGRDPTGDYCQKTRCYSTI